MNEKFLNGARAAELWEAMKGRSLPSKALTQEEYDALTEEEKRNGTLYMTPGVPSGGGSAPVPTGAVISFLALSAPSGYLICDGAEHSIAEFPGLSRYIKEQFGQVNHFGGDGEATFAVPDMRNLFLRGYHGEAGEQLSGEIGAKQEATSHPGIIGVQTSKDKAIFSYCSTTPTSSGINSINEDSVLRPSRRWALLSADGLSPMDSSDSDGFKVSYTSRPVNMAVLYCIKI